MIFKPGYLRPKYFVFANNGISYWVDHLRSFRLGRLGPSMQSCIRLRFIGSVWLFLRNKFKIKCGNNCKNNYKFKN